MKKILLLSLLLLGTAALAQTQNGLDFDGANDFIQTPFGGISGTANRTFEAWIFVSPSAPNNNLTILDYGSGATGARNTFMVNTNNGLSFFSGGTNANFSSTTGTITAGQWTHVAFILANGTGFLYIDGVQVGTGNLSGVNTTGSTDLRIGRRVPGGASLYFAGAIDEVRIWNTALSQNDLTTSSGSEICPSSNGLVAYYQFNEGMAGSSNTGLTTLPDLVSGNDGTLSSFSLNGGTSNWVTGAPIASLFIDTDITQNTGVLTATQTGASYQWINCATNMPVNGATGMSFTPTAIGNYAVDIASSNCTQRSDCENVSTLGLATTTLSEVFILQNPSSFLSFNGDLSSEAQVSIYTLSGKEILNTSLNDSQSINPAIARGLYIVTIAQNGASKTFKWIKE